VVVSETLVNFIGLMEVSKGDLFTVTIARPSNSKWVFVVYVGFQEQLVMQMCICTRWFPAFIHRVGKELVQKLHPPASNSGTLQVKAVIAFATSVQTYSLLHDV
jgi:hypothetical protein